MGRQFAGWMLLHSAIAWSMNISPGVSSVEIRRKQVPEKVVAEPVSHEIVA